REMCVRLNNGIEQPLECAAAIPLPALFRQRLDGDRDGAVGVGGWCSDRVSPPPRSRSEGGIPTWKDPRQPESPHPLLAPCGHRRRFWRDRSGERQPAALREAFVSSTRLPNREEMVRNGRRPLSADASFGDLRDRPARIWTEETARARKGFRGGDSWVQGCIQGPRGETA